MSTPYLTRVSRIIEELVRVPTYITVGATHDRVVFVSTKEGVATLWSMKHDGSDLKKLTREAVVLVPPVRSDLPYVIFTRDISKGKELHKVFYVDVRNGEEKLVAEIKPMRIFSLAYDSEKIVFTAATMEGIGLYQAKLDGSWEKLRDLSTIVFVTDVSKDYIVGYGNLRGDPRTYELMIYDYKTNELSMYTPKEGVNSKYPRILMSGEILFESNLNGRNKLYIYDPGSKSLREVRFGGNDYYKYSPVEHEYYGELSNGKVWAVGKRDGRSKLFIDGYEVKTPAGVITGFPAFIDEYVLTSISSLVSPPKIYRVNIKTGDIGIVINNKLPQDLESKLGSREFVRYKSFDGLEIPMYIIYSKDSPRPGPTILYVHGGPWAEVDDRWSILIASLVISGYHVLAPNFRGSTGYGDDFRALDIGDPGGGDLRDVIEAAKWGIERGIVDKDRLAIMGYSYGGYMTYLALGRYPDMWRCGVAGAGVVDWEEMYELSDAIFRKFIEVLFAGRKDLLGDRSPIKYVENVKAPLSIIHPQNDTRTPLKPVIRYMSKLLELGKSFEAHIIPDMGHMIIRIEDAEKILLPALLFLEKCLKK